MNLRRGRQTFPPFIFGAYMAKRNLGPKRKASIMVDINKIGHELRGIVLEEGIEVLGDLAERIAQEANNLAPVQDTGAAGPRRPGKWKQSGDPKDGPIKGNVIAMPSPNIPNTWVVMSDVWYAHFVEYGTDAYDPLPNKHQKTMVFKGRDGNWVRTKKVNRPNIQPRPYLRPAGDRAEEFLLQIINGRYGL